MIFGPLWAPFWLHFGTLWASIWNQNPTFWRHGPHGDYFGLLRHPPDVNFRPKMKDFGTSNERFWVSRSFKAGPLFLFFSPSPLHPKSLCRNLGFKRGLLTKAPLAAAD